MSAASSRLIVKNLPNGITEQRVRSLFEQKGTITDLSLKYTKDGVFRKIAFIGFLNEQQAQAAQSFFDRNFVDTSRIQVEICRPLGDAEKPRSWSQHSADSSRFQNKQPRKATSAALVSSAPKTEANDKFSQLMRNPLLTDEEKAMLESVKDSPEFLEFLKVQRNKSVRNLWDNDETSVREQNDSTSNQKIVKKPAAAVEGKEDFNKMKNAVKLKKLPKGVTKASLRDFFKPLNPVRVFLPKKAKDIAFVQFVSGADVKQALTYDQVELSGKAVHIVRCQEEGGEEEEDAAAVCTKVEDASESPDEVADHGRLFVRNLCFTCTEDDLERCFSKFGPLTEIHLPTDYITKKSIGFGYVTFMMPEHAVKAINALDGKDFQGRVLHVLPARPKPESELPFPTDAKSSYKKDKAVKQKTNGQSPSTWNTLFLGVNAVVDVMADRYQVSKSKILDADANSKQSVAVRVALGETQIVNDTKTFLETNGVKLDAFNQTNSMRSKTVIVAKNLPAGTLPTEILKLFQDHGTVARVVLPPGWITALIEMLDPTEAKMAFRNLAYSRFGKLPLFLEWAPVDVLQPVKPSPAVSSTEPEEKKEAQDLPKPPSGAGESVQQSSQVDAEDDDDVPSQPGCTIFVKSLNFSTTDQTLHDFFNRVGAVRTAAVARKTDVKAPDRMLSMGYGFVEYKRAQDAKEALKRLQHSQLEGQTLELKMSERTVRETRGKERKCGAPGKQNSAKLMVRNLAFQATEKEVRDMFKVFGEIKSVRLPRKMGESRSSHRGFCFVEYHSRSDAKKAFEALSTSTHLYSRRLVLDWANSDEQDVEALRTKVAHDFHGDEPVTKKLKKRTLYDELDQGQSAKSSEDVD